jgi:hypothetical protein
MAIKVGLNNLVRIGQTVQNAISERSDNEQDMVAVHDIGCL